MIRQTNYNTPADMVVIADGDGDGLSAAAISLMTSEYENGTFHAITNDHKSERDLVRKALETIPQEGLKGSVVGILDIDVETNGSNLEALLGAGVDCIDYFDHHSRSTPRDTDSIFYHIEPDSRTNCTATIVYDGMKKMGAFDTEEKMKKATALAIIGLANDGKESAAKKFGGDTIDENQRQELIKYAKALNFGASTGRGEGLEILDGLVKYQNPLDFLRQSEIVNGYVTERQEVITQTEERSQHETYGELNIYLLPSATAEDRETSTMAYNEMLNAKMVEDPESTYVGVLKTSDNKLRFSVRDAKGRALTLAKKLGKQYGSEARGRETAAGFDTQETDQAGIIERIKGAYDAI